MHVLEAVDPAAAILEFAEVNHVDHIVIGARQNSLLRTLLGSVSAKVAAEAACTVTVVRPPRIGVGAGRGRSDRAAIRDRKRSGSGVRAVLHDGALAADRPGELRGRRSPCPRCRRRTGCSRQARIEHSARGASVDFLQKLGPAVSRRPQEFNPPVTAGDPGPGPGVVDASRFGDVRADRAKKNRGLRMWAPRDAARRFG